MLYKPVSLKFFTSRVGQHVLRNGKPFYIKNVRYAWYLYQLRTHFTFKAVDSEEKAIKSMVQLEYEIL